MNDQLPSRTIPLITGPTAVGKTSVGIAIAAEYHGEIVSADARQVYRGLDIGTAKPSPAELERVPHHFISELEPHEPFSAGLFADVAERRISEILERRCLPVVLGGSTLYIEALVNGFSDIPTIDEAIRTTLNERLATEGAESLFRELAAVDPKSAGTMDETKSQRIVRALEVFQGTGTRLSEFQSSRSSPAFRYSGVVLERPRPQLYHRINRRVESMLAEGLLEEVRSLLDGGLDPSLNALRSIGYREVVSYLQGEIDHREMTRLIQRNTRRYAKRQLTWLRRYKDFRWLDADSPMEAIRGALGLDSR